MSFQYEEYKQKMNGYEQKKLDRVEVRVGIGIEGIEDMVLRIVR